MSGVTRDSRRLALSTRFRRPVVDNYIPQWAATPTPAGFQDQAWIYEYTFPVSDGSNYPLSNFPLPFDLDADFILRGCWVSAFESVNKFPTGSALFALLRDPYGNRLADDFQPFVTLGTPFNFIYGFAAEFNQETLGAPAPFEPEIFCPAGSNMLIDLRLSPGVGPGPTPVVDQYVGRGGGTLIFFGVKRYRSCQ